MKKIRVAILGVTGYLGSEAKRLLLPRKDVEIVCASVERYSGSEEEIEKLKRAEVIFSFLPHEQSMHLIPELLDMAELGVIDASGAYRLKNPLDYPIWYQFQNYYPKLLNRAIYGLPEMRRRLIYGAKLVASAGCYETAMILGLWPLVVRKLISSDITVKAISGYSGGGRGAKIPKSITPYRPVRQHQHIPAVEQELGIPGKIMFYPHIAPFRRGIEMTISAEIKEEMATEEMRSFYKSFYADEPFVRIKDEVSRKKVNYRNFCDIACRIDGRKAEIYVALDNLRKGGASQAIQNFNIVCGLPETQGLL